MTQFSERAWTETSGLYHRILDLRFNRELAAGTLSQARFRFYMMQDALYLTQYARALAAAAAKAPDIGSMQFFAKASETALAVERSLHGGFFAKFGIDPAEAAAAEPSPTCYGYTNFLLATAFERGYAELTAAILPCFWIYGEVGTHIAGIAQPDNPYRAWIDTYSDPGFGEAVKTAIALCDAAAEAATPAEARAMLGVFKRSVQYEWMFWDSAYRQEAWPVRAG